MKTIKILIPIYNEEESLLFLRNRLTSIINKLINYRIEVLFINDGSKDNSLKIIEGIRKKIIDLNIYRFQETLERK